MLLRSGLLCAASDDFGVATRAHAWRPRSAPRAAPASRRIPAAAPHVQPGSRVLINLNRAEPAEHHIFLILQIAWSPKETHTDALFLKGPIFK